jgi:AraC-like DNA-binding protein
MEQAVHIKTISQYHRLRDLPEPQHPLISVINFNDIKHKEGHPLFIINHFYSIALKRTNAKYRYGQQEYDFDSGILAFLAPKQVLKIIVSDTDEFINSGWLILIHPDFFFNSTLIAKIKQYDFFGYNANEALHLSEKEEETLMQIFKNINDEYQSNIDKYSQNVIIAQLELLLTYSERFYNRQFITRNKVNHLLLNDLEGLLNTYFQKEEHLQMGLPTVEYISSKLNISRNYLNRLIKTYTGQTTQQIIQDKLINLAKERLSTTQLSVSEIAYELGFEHSQSFNKLFKSKTNQSPLEFRASFN